MDLKKFIYKVNKKITLCPGPGSLLRENILGLRNSFGRGDIDYLKIEKYVLDKLKKLSGQRKIVTFQGSGTLAIEMMFLNFLSGRILIVSTGFYSDRLFLIAKRIALSEKKITNISRISWKEISKVKKIYNWVIACPTETSIGLLLPIKDLKKLANKTKAKLMLDATASIGLEKNHNLADVISFSSCKGLFGLTGASFISYKTTPKNKVNSFYLDINTHLNKYVTGPYHIINSMYYVLKDFKNIQRSVLINKAYAIKNMEMYLVYKKKNQPKLCTFLNKAIKYAPSNYILYKPRKKIDGTVISHLGELYLKSKSKGLILKKLKYN
jgi:aspartate aminotransferase-like enzyme